MDGKWLAFIRYTMAVTCREWDSTKAIERTGHAFECKQNRQHWEIHHQKCCFCHFKIKIHSEFFAGMPRQSFHWHSRLEQRGKNNHLFFYLFFFGGFCLCYGIDALCCRSHAHIVEARHMLGMIASTNETHINCLFSYTDEKKNKTKYHTSFIVFLARVK